MCLSPEIIAGNWYNTLNTLCIGTIINSTSSRCIYVCVYTCVCVCVCVCVRECTCVETSRKNEEWCEWLFVLWGRDFKRYVKCRSIHGRFREFFLIKKSINTFNFLNHNSITSWGHPCICMCMHMCKWVCGRVMCGIILTYVVFFFSPQETVGDHFTKRQIGLASFTLGRFTQCQKRDPISLGFVFHKLRYG